MGKYNKIFFQGLVTLIPLAATVYILYSGIVIIENILGSVFRTYFPALYIPGVGFIATLLVVFIFGLIVNHYLAGRFLQDFEARLLKVPFFKAIYSPLKDLMNLFSKSDGKSMQRVVLVKINGDGLRAMGLVTRENFDDLNLQNHLDGRLAVYIPLSYGLGGYTLMVKKEDLIEVDIPIEKAMSLAITGWVKSNPKNFEQNH
jgi:uncharacterized membrane protein